MPTFTTELPPTRTTGDAPAGGPAADVNLLSAAVAEVRTKTPDPGPTATSTFMVVSGGTNLSVTRPAGAGAVLFKFSAGVDVGTGGANITNAQPGDQWFVASA